MKKAIEKWVKEGGDLHSLFLPKNILGIKILGWFAYDAELSIQYEKKGIANFYVDYYRLIFDVSLGFIDKLVGRPDTLFCVANRCSKKELLFHPNRCSGCKTAVLGTPVFHREKMANIKDVEHLKKYVRSLI